MCNIDPPSRQVLQHGETALMLAGERDNLAAIAYLVEHGANVNAKDRVGNLSTAIAQQLVR